MYITQPTHGAGTRPSRTQPPTATRKTSLNAGQCVRQPREGRGRNRQTPPKKKQQQGGRGGDEGTADSHQTARQHHKRRPNSPPRRHRRQDFQRGTGGPPSQNRQHQARNSGPTEKGTTKTRRHTPRWKKKKEPATQPERGGMGGQGPQGPGQGRPATNTTKPKQDTPEKKNTPRQPNQEERGTAETRAQHARPHSTHRPGKAGNKRGVPTNTHPRTAPLTRRCEDRAGRAHEHTRTPTPPKEWRGAAETQTPTRTPAPHTGTGNGGVQTEHACNHARVKSRPKPKPNHKHHKPQPAKEERHHKPYPNTPAADPSQDWRGYLNPHPSTTRTQTQTPHNSRTPSVHSPGTEAARAMQLTRPNEIRSPGVRLVPKACAAFGLEAERATPKRLGTLVPRTCMHALETGYVRKSGEPLGFRPKEGKGKGKLLGRSPNSSVSVIPTCPSQHPFRLAGSPTP